MVRGVVVATKRCRRKGHVWLQQQQQQQQQQQKQITDLRLQTCVWQ